MAYTPAFYQQALTETEEHIVETMDKLKFHSPGTPARQELSVMLQELRVEFVELIPLAYPEKPFLFDDSVGD